MPVVPGPGAPDGAELEPAAGVDDDDVVDVLVVECAGVLVEPLVDARATPVTPPPTAAAIAAVSRSRRTRPELLEPMWLPPSVLGPRWRGPGAGPPVACALPSGCEAEPHDLRSGTLSVL